MRARALKPEKKGLLVQGHMQQKKQPFKKQIETYDLDLQPFGLQYPMRLFVSPRILGSPLSAMAHGQPFFGSAGLGVIVEKLIRGENEEIRTSSGGTNKLLNFDVFLHSTCARYSHLPGVGSWRTSSRHFSV